MITTFALLLVLYLFLITYYIVGWNRLKQFIPAPQDEHIRVSVVVSVRNEAADIENCIRHILDQNYPEDKMELIVVDDYSTDETCEIVESIKDNRLTLMKLRELPGDHSPNTPNKKYALTSAINIAKGKLIMVTDGDCVMNSNWIDTITSFYKKYKAGFIAGPVLLSGPNSMLSKFQELDMISMTAVAAAAIRNNNPTLSNAANMAFEKELFVGSGGFGIHANKPSGDDLYLMHKFQLETDRQVMYCKNRDALVKSKTVNTFSEFIEQRKRWVSKSTNYQKKSVTLTLLLAYLFNIAIVISALLGLAGNEAMTYFFITSLSLKLCFDLAFLFPVCRFYERSSLLSLFLPVQLLHIIYVVVIGFLGMLFNYKWKGRTVHKSITFRSGKIEN